jgi:hypothetical protein
MPVQQTSNSASPYRNTENYLPTSAVAPAPSGGKSQPHSPKSLIPVRVASTVSREMGRDPVDANAHVGMKVLQPSMSDLSLHSVPLAIHPDFHMEGSPVDVENKFSMRDDRAYKWATAAIRYGRNFTTESITGKQLFTDILKSRTFEYRHALTGAVVTFLSGEAVPGFPHTEWSKDGKPMPRLLLSTRVMLPRPHGPLLPAPPGGRIIHPGIYRAANDFFSELAATLSSQGISTKFVSGYANGPADWTHQTEGLAVSIDIAPCPTESIFHLLEALARQPDEGAPHVSGFVQYLSSILVREVVLGLEKRVVPDIPDGFIPCVQKHHEGHIGLARLAMNALRS